MKNVRICFLVSLCLCVFCFNPAMAETSSGTDQPDLTADTAAETQPAANQDDEMAPLDTDGEGEIVFTASVDPVPEARESDVTIVEARICEGIIEREPVAPGDVFPSDINELYCFSRVKSDENTEIKHIWYCNGEPVAEVPLNIGASSGWRTFSSKNISTLDKGNWKVEIVTAGGDPVKTIQFIIN